MAVDKLVDSAQLDGYFTNIATAIRAKAGTASTYTPSEMPQAIQDIPSGGGELKFKNTSLKPTSKTEFIVTGIEAEPKLFFLYLSQDQTTAASMPNYLLAVDSIGKNCLYIKQNGTQYSVQSTPITFFGTKRLEYSYENGQFTITVLNTTSVGQLLTQKNYIFAYAY